MSSIATDTYKTAAVLMAHGFCLSGTRVDGDRVVFLLDAAGDRDAVGRHIVGSCSSGYMDVQVHLGKYEDSLDRVRAAMRAHQGDIRRRRSSTDRKVAP
jgi:hypothetical protein